MLFAYFLVLRCSPSSKARMNHHWKLSLQLAVYWLRPLGEATLREGGGGGGGMQNWIMILRHLKALLK